MDIDPEGQFPFLVGDVGDVLEASLVRGIVDQDVDAAKFSYGRLDDLPAVGGILDVARNQHRFTTCGFYVTTRLLGIFVFLEIGNENVCPLPCIGDGDSTANATVTTGNDSFLVF